MVKQKISDEDIVRLYNESLSDIKIAQLYGLHSSSSIWYRRNKLGLKSIRPRKKHQLREGYKELTKEKAYLLGVFVGDGYVNRVNAVLGLGALDLDFVKEFIRCFRSVYGLELHFKDNRKYNCVFAGEIHSTEVKQDLFSYRASFYKEDWRVPNVIKNSSQKLQAIYLRGFFDSEGSVSSYNYQLTARSINLKGLTDIQLLLGQVGIESKVYHETAHAISKRNRAKKIYFVLSITKKVNIQRFEEGVGFTIKRQQKRLRKLIERYHANYRFVRYPLEKIIGKYLKGRPFREIRREYGISGMSFYSALKRRNIHFRQSARGKVYDI